MAAEVRRRLCLLGPAFADQVESAPGSALAALKAQHLRNRRESLSYRLCDRPWLLPLSSFITWVEWLDRQILTEGLAEASRRALDRLGLTVERVLPAETRAFLEGGGGVLLAGDHPAFALDLLAVSACLSPQLPADRLRFQGLHLLAGLGPGFASCLFPVTITRAASDRIEQRRHRYTDQGGPPASVLKTFMPDLSREEAARRTRRALRQLVDYWVTGGSVIVFPGGGGGAGAPWYPSLGRLIADALTRPDHARAAVVFFYLEGADDRLLWRPPLVSPYHPGILLRSRRLRSSKGGPSDNGCPPLRVTLSSPRELRSFLPAPPSPQDAVRITQQAQAMYQRM